MISEQDQQTIRNLFEEHLSEDVKITYFTQKESPLILPGHECEYCKETRELLQEVTGLSEKLDLEVKDFVADKDAAAEMGIERIPAFTLEGQSRGRVRFFGVPSGYEFSAVLQDIMDVSTGEPGLSEDTLAQLEELEEDLHIQVFTTPT